MWNTCLSSGGLGNSFVSIYGSKLGVSEGYVGRTLVGLEKVETGVSVLG